MKRPMRSVVTALLAATLAVTVAACGTTSGKPTAGEIDVRTLDVGKYPTEPLDINGDTEPGIMDWSQTGSLRMAESVATPDQVDPQLIYSGGEYDSESFSAGAPKLQLGEGTVVEDILKRDHMYFGFTSSGYDKDLTTFTTYDWPTMNKPGKGLVLTVMQFATADDAKHAAADLQNAVLGQFHDQNQPVTLAKYPDAQAQWQPGVATLESFLPHSRFVIGAQVATPAADLSALTTLAQQAYDVQQPLLDSFKAVTDEDAIHLPLDPDYLLSRTLNLEQSESPAFDDLNVAVGAHTYLHYTPNRQAARKLLDALGATGVARTDKAILIKAKDAATAKKAVADHLTTQSAGAPADAPARVPDSACLEFPTDGTRARYTCMVAYRQYVGYLQASQLTDAQQMAAAQYALLANSQWE